MLHHFTFSADTVGRIELSSAEKSMVKEAMKTAEYHDSYDTVTAEAARIADMIRNSSHCVAFTGAGISTSAGTPAMIQVKQESIQVGCVPPSCPPDVTTVGRVL